MYIVPLEIPKYCNKCPFGNCGNHKISTNNSHDIKEIYGCICGIEFQKYGKNTKIIRGEIKKDILRPDRCELKEYKERKPWGDELNRFVTRIEKPDIYREFGNTDKKTFDFIKVCVHIIKDYENKNEFIETHKKDIGNMVLQKIEENTQYKKFGIPISFLELSNVTITNDSCIVYLFQLKWR